MAIKPLSEANKERSPFKIYIYQKPEEAIVGVMPDDVSVSFNQEYFELAKEMIPEQIQAILKTTLGKTLTYSGSNAYQWTGVSPLHMSLDIEFHSDKEPNEAFEKARKLMSFGSPSSVGSQFGGVGMAVGPPPIAVVIGNYIRFPSVFITAVSPVFSRPYLKGGYPAKVAVNFSFQTTTFLTAGSINEWFKITPFNLLTGKPA